MGLQILKWRFDSASDLDFEVKKEWKLRLSKKI
jgi:hypothetical protein